MYGPVRAQALVRGRVGRADRRPRARTPTRAVRRWAASPAARRGRSGDDRRRRAPIAERAGRLREPRPRPRRLGGLIDRLAAAGRLRGARLDGRAIGAGGLADVEVRGVTDDSRAVRPGRAVRRDRRAATSTATTSSPGGRGRRRRGHRRAPAPRARAAAARRRPDAAGAGDARPRGGTAIPSRRARRGRDHRHGRQDDDVVPRRRPRSRPPVCPTGLIGTVATRIGGSREPNAEHATTPSAPSCRRRSARWSTAATAAAVIETTSHGLALDRVGGIAYDVAILTNLSHEHLEFHGSCEAYRDAKLSPVRAARAAGRRAPSPRAPAGRGPASSTPTTRRPAAFVGVTQEAGARVLTYGTDPSADVRADRVEEDARGLRVARRRRRARALDLRLAGRFNAHNALAVVALGEAFGLDPAAIRDGLASARARAGTHGARRARSAVRGHRRLRPQPGLARDGARPARAGRGGARRRLIAVFGSAGERDTAKRPLMGRIAGERARLVVVTDEDPRGEDRDAILDEIARGAEAAGRRRGHDLLLIADRRAAIAAAFERARPGDIVLLAGKGHERSIIGADGPVPWDERSEAEGALRRMGYG